MTTETTQAEQLNKLRAPFEPHQVSILCRSTKKDNPKGSCPKCKGYHGLPAIQLDYVGHAAVTDRLLSVDPMWSWAPQALTPQGLPMFDAAGGLWIWLTVCGMTRPGYGDASGKTGPDATKETIGDAIRNAAMRFGVALDLWHKGELHAPPVDDRKADAPKDEKMPEDVFQGHLALIKGASDIEKLQGIYKVAYKAAKDKDSQLAFMAAKDARKAELQGGVN